MNRTKNAMLGIVWGIVNKILTIILPFILRTVILHKMGGLYLGINGLFSSILNVLNLTELGISSAIVFSMYAPIADGETEKVNELLYFYKKCYKIIGTIILFLGLFITPFLNCFISGEYPADINIYLVYLIHLFSVVISYLLFAYKRSLFQACQRNDVLSNINSVIAIFQYGFQIIIIMKLRSYYAYILIMPIMIVLNNLMTAVVSEKMYPQYFPHGNLDIDERKRIWHKVKGLIFQKLGVVILTSVDTIVISSFLGLGVLAVYQNYYYIVSSVIGILDVVFTALVSGVGNSVAKETLDYNYDMFKKINMSYVLLVSVCATIMSVLMQPFIRIWTGNEYVLPDIYVILFVMYFFVYKWCDILNVYQQACGIWYETRYVPLFASCVNFVINIVLVRRIGLLGILFSTIISFVFIYNFLYAKYIFNLYFKNYKGGLYKFVLRQLLYMTICIIVSVACWFSAVFIISAEMIGLLLKAVYTVVASCVLYYLFYRNFDEFFFVRNKIIFVLGYIKKEKMKFGKRKGNLKE